MSEPLFRVGQDVALISSDCKLVIPKTVITDVNFFAGGLIESSTSGRVVYEKASWEYLVRGSEFWTFERCLRPINPDTEYLDTTQDLAAPVDEVSV